jgi:ATP-dependent protease ClpP protease subunit
MAEEDLIAPKPEVFSVTKVPKSHVYDVYLSDVVDDRNESYFGLLQILRQVTKDDEVIVYLANRGGSCQVGLMLITAFKHCPAHVTMNVVAPCYSMGACLALCGNALIMQPSTFLMFHNYSGGSEGKGGELLQGTIEYSKHSMEFTKHFCTPFLSPEELKKIENDQDVYVHSNAKDLKSRIRRHFK